VEGTVASVLLSVLSIEMSSSHQKGDPAWKRDALRTKIRL